MSAQRGAGVGAAAPLPRASSHTLPMSARELAAEGARTACPPTQSASLHEDGGGDADDAAGGGADGVSRGGADGDEGAGAGVGAAVAATPPAAAAAPSAPPPRPPPLWAWAVLAVAVVAMSSGGVWFALQGDTPPMMRAGWRLLLTSMLQLPACVAALRAAESSGTLA